MIIDLLNGGLAALTAQSGQSDKLVPTRWVLGDATDFTFATSLSSVQGTVLSTGNASTMVYVPLTEDEASIICRVPDTAPVGIIGNLVLYVSFQGTEYPFCMVRENTSDIQNTKLQRPDNAVGMELNISIALALIGIESRIDFSVMVMETPTWLSLADDKEVPSPLYSQRNNMMIDTHFFVGGPVPVFAVGAQWFGLPTMRLMGDGQDTVNLTELSGGVSGDDYKK